MRNDPAVPAQLSCLGIGILELFELIVIFFATIQQLATQGVLHALFGVINPFLHFEGG